MHAGKSIYETKWAIGASSKIARPMYVRSGKRHKLQSHHVGNWNIINIEIFLTRMFWWDKSIICVAVIVAVDYYPVYSYSDAGMQLM